MANLVLTILIGLSAHGAIDRDFTTPREASDSIQKLAKSLQKRGNPRGLFAGIYAVTIRATEKRMGEFHNPQWVSQLVVNYANIYRRTIHAELNGKRRTLPKTWQLTFNYEDSPDWCPALDVIYGIHVHIVRDLVEALYMTPANFRSKSIRRDFYHISNVLKDAMPQIWQVYDRYARIFPEFARIGESTFVDWIARQRDYAWRAHSANVNYTPQQQKGLLGRIDRWAYSSAVSQGFFLPVSM